MQPCSRSAVQRCSGAAVRRCGRAAVPQPCSRGRTAVRPSGLAAVQPCGAAALPPCGAAALRCRRIRGDGGEKDPETTGSLRAQKRTRHPSDIRPAGQRDLSSSGERTRAVARFAEDSAADDCRRTKRSIGHVMLTCNGLCERSRLSARTRQSRTAGAFGPLARPIRCDKEKTGASGLWVKKVVLNDR